MILKLNTEGKNIKTNKGVFKSIYLAASAHGMSEQGVIAKVKDGDFELTSEKPKMKKASSKGKDKPISKVAMKKAEAWADELNAETAAKKDAENSVVLSDDTNVDALKIEKAEAERNKTVEQSEA